MVQGGLSPSLSHNVAEADLKQPVDKTVTTVGVCILVANTTMFARSCLEISWWCVPRCAANAEVDSSLSQVQTLLFPLQQHRLSVAAGYG